MKNAKKSNALYAVATSQWHQDVFSPEGSKYLTYGFSHRASLE